MAPQSRKRLSSLLLFIAGVHILLPVVLSLATYFIKVAQRQVVDQCNRGSGELVHFPLADVAPAIEDGKEFFYGSTMYDIKSVEVEDGAYVVYALPDKKETKLEKVKENVGGDTKSKVLPFVFLFHQHPPVFLFTINISAPQQLGYYATHLLMTSIAVNGPPPRSVFMS